VTGPGDPRRDARVKPGHDVNAVNSIRSVIAGLDPAIQTAPPSQGLCGGTVTDATTLTGSRSSEILAQRSDTLHQLREKFPDLEDKWKAAFGHDFSGLTQGEATYLLRSRPADALGDRIVAGRQAGDPPAAE
jgi:hypothetical protein